MNSDAAKSTFTFAQTSKMYRFLTIKYVNNIENKVEFLHILDLNWLEQRGVTIKDKD